MAAQSPGDTFSGRSRSFPSGTRWGLWKTVRPSTHPQPRGSCVSGSPHLVPGNLLRISAKSAPAAPGGRLLEPRFSCRRCLLSFPITSSCDICSLAGSVKVIDVQFSGLFACVRMEAKDPAALRTPGLGPEVLECPPTVK